VKWSKETVKKLRWLQKQLTKYPHRYDQEEWCGTRACLAGFCLPRALRERRVTLTYDAMHALGVNRGYSLLAAKWLGLDSQDAAPLFRATWDPPFGALMSAAKSDAARARIAVRRIDHFIKTGR
jgi:hypothetical protein